MFSLLTAPAEYGIQRTITKKIGEAIYGNTAIFQGIPRQGKGLFSGQEHRRDLGAPFECIRGVYDIDYYTHDLSLGVLPNDDLDLQLVWLNAAEQYGRGVDAEILGEYWLSYIVADWSEYGAGKNNLRYGLVPPNSGW